MRIGFFTDRYLPQTDGIVVSIETFRQEMEALGHEVYVIAPAPGLRYKEPSKRVIRFPAVKGLWGDFDYLTSLYFPPQAIRRLEKLNLDLIHFHGPGQIGLLGAYFAIKNDIPLVTTYHTDLYEYVTHYKSVLPGTIALSLLAPLITGGGLADYRTSLSSIKPERNVDRWNQKIVERGITLIHNRCDMVVAPSRKMQQQLQAWKSKSPVVILPTGVNKITTTAKDIIEWRHKLNLNSGDEIVLFVGRLGSEKNLALLVKAFELIVQKRPHAKLIAVGDHPDREEIEAEAKATTASENIIFTGYVPHDELGALYGLAHVFAFPSLTDTQGLVVNEAAAAGLPIVMCDRGITEVVQHGYNGYYAKPNAKDLAAKIISILKDPEVQDRLGSHSEQLAAEFNASKQAAKLLGLYQEVIKRRHATPATAKRPLPWGRKSDT